MCIAHSSSGLGPGSVPGPGEPETSSSSPGSQVLPGELRLRPGRWLWSLQFYSLPAAPKAALPTVGLLVMGFLDPIQRPFNYSRQMAMPAIGGNRISIPGDSGAGEGEQQPCSSEPFTDGVASASATSPRTTLGACLQARK